MSDKQKNSITCIEMGDQLFDTLRKEYNTLKNSEKFLAVNELAKQRRILGAQYGLICEYYLKGMILNCYKINVSTMQELTQEEKEKIEEVLNNINEEEEYNLLIGDTNTLNEMVRRFQLTKKIKNVISQQSLKKIGGNGHSLGAFFEHLPANVKHKIFMNMEEYYSSIKKPISKEEWKAFLSGFLKIENKNYEQFDKNKEELNQIIGDSKVSDAFFNGRYGHFENYIPNLDALYYLSYSIRESVKEQFPNAISLTDGIKNGYIDSNNIRYIYPDLESKIYVFDGGKSLSRVYRLMRDEDFIEKYGVINQTRNNQSYSIYPEFGIEKMKKMSFNSLGEKVIYNSFTPIYKILHVSPDEISIIVCTVNGKEIVYAYNNRKFHRNKKRLFRKI